MTTEIYYKWFLHFKAVFELSPFKSSNAKVSNLQLVGLPQNFFFNCYAFVFVPNHIILITKIQIKTFIQLKTDTRVKCDYWKQIDSCLCQGNYHEAELQQSQLEFELNLLNHFPCCWPFGQLRTQRWGRPPPPIHVYIWST